jgi:hypothetical protein
MAENKLITLLSIDPSKMTKPEEFANAFNNIADQLMKYYLISINGHKYRLAELEFYLNDANHPDIFTHGNKSQLTCGQWYFHKTGSSYKGGSFKGLDITFSTRGYGGILIRAIKSVDDDTYIEGPCNVVNTILNEYNVDNVSDFVSREDFNLEVDMKGPIYILRTEENKIDKITTSGRFGLVLRNDDQVPYVLRPYRYMSFPSEVRKGRQHLVLELHYKNVNSKKISDLTGCGVPQINKWTKKYDDIDSSIKPSSYYGKKLNAAEFSAFYNVLRKKAQY